MIGERYTLHEQIGVGGMATVWRATDNLLGRDVAVKRPIPHLLTFDAEQRFHREAQAAARLSHPGILTVYDAGEDDEGPWLVMELIRGRTLAAVLAGDGPMPPATVASIAEQAAAALDHAHQKGIVHRDVKPANLILEPDGRVRLTDFGIARPVDEAATITTTGDLVGTVSYLAPEVARGARSTPASDIYSLGAVVFELLAGHPPFSASTTAELIERIARGNPPPLPPTVPPAMASAVAAAMAPDPAQRPPTAADFAGRLSQGSTLVMTPATVPAPPPAGPDGATVAIPGRTPPPPRRRWLPWVATLVAALTSAVVAFAAIRDDDTTAAATTSTATTEPVAVPTTQAVTTTTTLTPTTTTTVATTTTITTMPRTADSVVSEIAILVEGLRPPEFHPREIERVEERFRDFLREWQRDDMDDAESELRGLYRRVRELPRSQERTELTSLIEELSQLLDLDLDLEEED